MAVGGWFTGRSSRNARNDRNGTTTESRGGAATRRNDDGFHHREHRGHRERGRWLVSVEGEYENGICVVSAFALSDFEKKPRDYLRSRRL